MLRLRSLSVIAVKPPPALERFIAWNVDVLAAPIGRRSTTGRSSERAQELLHLKPERTSAGPNTSRFL